MPRGATAEHRAEVVSFALEHGVTTAANEFGHGKGTVSRWIKAAGGTVSCERNAKAIEAIKANAEERRARLAEKLLEIAELGADLEVTLMQGASLRDVVGARTRAIHDAQLLSGAATSRSEHQTVDHLDREIQKLLETAA